MNRLAFWIFLLVAALPVAVPGVWACDNATAVPGMAQQPPVTTSHRIRAGTLKLSYTATAGFLTVKEEPGRPAASMFFVAYSKQEKSSPTRRPITFAFNGGPGSSSVWLHLGAIGPVRVRLGDDGSAPSPPPELVDNEFTWLRFTDVVFIDPVGTGYSRAADQKQKKKFYDYKKDIDSVGEFIRLYLTRNNRWLSPKYIVGESYGTTRAAGLAEHLHTAYGIDLNGVLLISPVLEFSTIAFDKSNDLPFAAVLPTYAAAARYHTKQAPAGEGLQDLLREVENWVADAYVPALARGHSLEAGQRRALAAKMAEYTGLPAEYIHASNFRIPPWRFRKELLRGRALIIGRMDARFTGPDVDRAGNAATYDPGLDPFAGSFSSAVNHYIRTNLQFKSDLPYEYLNYDVGRNWDFKSALKRGQGYVNVTGGLSRTMNIQTGMKVFIAAGYYDMATPYWAAQYTLNHLDLSEKLRQNISLAFYNAGHMMYLDPPSLKKLVSDVGLFYRRSSGSSAR